MQTMRKNLYIIFLRGFMSDLEGEKPKAFFNYCKKKSLGFLGLEYSGHGKSSGKFTMGNISKWSKETKIVIKKIKRFSPSKSSGLGQKKSYQITNEYI